MSVPAVPVFGGRLDRLSSLIERFRVHAQIVDRQLDDERSANFLVFRRPDQTMKLVFWPVQEDDGNGHKHYASKTGEVPAVAAYIEISGVGDHLAAALPACISVELNEAPELNAVVGPLVAEVEQPRCGGQAVFHRLCEIVVIRLLRHTLESGAVDVGLMAGLVHPRLARALVAIHKAPEKSWNLEKLASEAGMSRTQFAITFREVLGQTPGAYLSNWRLEVARVELEAGAQVNRVARQCGFASPAAFSRAFARRFGHTPRAERRRNAA